MSMATDLVGGGKSWHKRACVGCGHEHSLPFLCPDCWDSYPRSRFCLKSGTDHEVSLSILTWLRHTTGVAYTTEGDLIESDALLDVINDAVRTSAESIPAKPKREPKQPKRESDFFKYRGGANKADIRMTLNRLKKRREDLIEQRADAAKEISIIDKNISEWEEALK